MTISQKAKNFASIFTALMLTFSGANLVASHTPSPYSEIEPKAIQAHKRLCSDISQKMQTVQQASTSENTQITALRLNQEAEKEKYSRRAQLKARLYEILKELPTELICLITTYDSHVLSGKLQCTIPTQETQLMPSTIVALSNSTNGNIFYAQTADGLTYWCNAATGLSTQVIRQTNKKVKPHSNHFPEAPKLVRSHAILNQAIKFPDGTIAQSQGKNIIISTPESDKKTPIMCKANDLVLKLLALPDGRLVTGLFNGQVHIWV